MAHAKYPLDAQSISLAVNQAISATLGAPRIFHYTKLEIIYKLGKEKTFVDDLDRYFSPVK